MFTITGSEEQEERRLMAKVCVNVYCNGIKIKTKAKCNMVLCTLNEKIIISWLIRWSEL